MKKSIVLYGAGLAGEKFYCMNKNKYEIEYVIDKNANRYFHNIPVYTFEEKENELIHKNVVVAVQTIAVYNEIRKNLDACGCKEFENYVYWKKLGLKLAIIYGNCHFDVLAEYLNNNQEFCRKYFIKRCSITGVECQYPSDEELNECDLLITQDIRKNNYLNAICVDELTIKLSKKAQVIKVPNLYGYNLFFPQTSEFLEAKAVRNHIHKNAIYVNNGQVYHDVISMQGWNDANIEALREAGKDIDEIVSIIDAGKVYSKEDIINNFESEMNKIKKREENCDIKISDFILANYRDMKLFYDPRHPSRELIYEKARRILKILEIEDCIDKKLYSVDIDATEIFIYGCVKEALGLRFKEKYIRRTNSMGTFWDRPINLKEYVKQYVVWDNK